MARLPSLRLALLRRLGRRLLARPRLLAATAAVLVACTTGAAIWIRCGALPVHLLDLDAQPSLVIVDRRGEPIYEARSSLGTRGDRLTPADVPPVLAAATLAAEDERFRSHIGLDPVAIARAAWRNLRARRVVEGGSTVTQQLAKLLLARQNGGHVAHGWLAKAREAVVALRLEHRLTKDEILALYLTVAPYGNQIEGAARASQMYFGHAPANLTAAEAAFLAALPQVPTRYNPWHDPSRARQRALRIMNTMARRGWLSGADLAVARAERLALTRPLSTTVAPHFVDHVLADVADAHPRRVETTLDATLQREVQGIIDARRRTLDAHHADDVAVAVLDNQTGEWLAWEGSGRDISSEGGAIDGVTVPRQPGSALKPFTYAAAFERGFDPASVLADVPSQFGTDEPGVLYSPRNYDGQYRGPLLARAALAGSENVPAVVLASDIGVPTIARFLRRAGFSSLGDNAAHYGLGLTLGNAEVRLDEMVAAYAMFARGGEWMKPTAIRAIDGRPIAAASTVRLVSPRTAFWITDILSDNDARAYTFGRGGSLEFTFPVAAKTGTSTAYHDNWAVGYTRDVTVGVWVGNFDRTPLRDSSGVTGAGPIFHAVMLAAVERTHGSTDSSAPILPPVSNVKRVRVCALSGLAAGAACPIRTDEWLPADAPRDQCTWHHASDEGVITVWPEAYRDWARDAGLLVALTSPSAHRLPPTAYSPSGAAPRLPPTAYSPSGAAPRLPPNAPRPPPTAYSLPLAAPRPTASGPLAIVTPLAGAVYLVDPTLRREFQALPLRASGGAPGARQWFVDDSPLGLEKDDALLRWPLAVGEHAFTVRDATGRTATTKIVVK